MFRSATFKLTLWYLGIAMAISILFSVALYSVTTGELKRGLHNESQSLYNQFPVFQGDPRFGFNSNPFYQSSAHRILLRLLGFNVLVLVLAGGSSYLLAKRTLGPIEVAHLQQKRFTSDVSHELRTPLTAIRMESEVALLNAKIPAKELRQTLESNLEEVDKLENLINNLLRLSRLEADELKQNFGVLTNTEIVSTAIKSVSKLAGHHSIVIDQNVMEAKLPGDIESLSQLLVILIDNAIKYSPNGSGITIESKPGKDSVIFKVKDSGTGIEPLALEHIFDRFYRADSSRAKTNIEGFGLGLSIAKMIAEIHQGHITISSQLEKGTTATVKLPKYVSAVPESKTIKDTSD
jgi:signal transduction histidine kinase